MIIYFWSILVRSVLVNLIWCFQTKMNLDAHLFQKFLGGTKKMHFIINPLVLSIVSSPFTLGSSERSLYWVKNGKISALSFSFSALLVKLVCLSCFLALTDVQPVLRHRLMFVQLEMKIYIYKFHASTYFRCTFLVEWESRDLPSILSAIGVLIIVGADRETRHIDQEVNYILIY